MTPRTPLFLTQSALKLLLEAMPALPPGYLQGTTGTIAMLLFLAAQDTENGAALRTAENAKLRALLNGILDRAPTAPWHTQVRNLMPAAAESLAISALDAEGAALKAALIIAHEAVEQDASPSAAQAEAEILQALREISAARRLTFPAL